MRKVEYTLLGITILALFLKIQFVPGGASLLVLSASTLTIFYYMYAPLLFTDKWDEKFDFSHLSAQAIKTDNKRFLIIQNLSRWVLSMIILGVLFNLQYWPGGRLLLTIGLIAAVITYYLIRNSKFANKEKYGQRVNNRLLAFTLIGMIIISKLNGFI